MRDDFSQGVKDLLARRVSYRCSNPDCQALTVGPATDTGKSVNLGVASHITAASPGGPRYNLSLSPAQRQSADNGIWLCQTCSVHIDRDVLKYPVDLRTWKRQAEEAAASALGKGAAIHSDLTSVASALSGQLAPPVAQQVTAMILAALQTPARPSSDAIDTDLDEAKQELEQHQPSLARRLAQRVRSRYGNSLSGWQRWRAETLVANTYIAEGDLLRAGQMLVDARRHDSTGEKARINEVVGYELLGQTAKAHDLAEELRREMPASPPVLALWVRTAPAAMPSSDVEEGSRLLAGTNADVALALVSILLFRGEAERAEPYAVSATQLQPDAPQAWLLLGQAVHLRGHSAVCLAQRSELLRRAETHYAKTIELADAQQRRHIEAGVRLNRAVLRDLLGDVDQAGDDYREAIRLAPDDSDIVRRYAVFLSMHGRQDDAINEARHAAQITPTAPNEVVLAGLLYERAGDGDCEEAVGLCHRMLGRNEVGRLAEKYEIATVCFCRLRNVRGRDRPLCLAGDE